MIIILRENSNLRAVFLGLAAALLLTGCGRTAEPTDPTGTTTPPSVPQETVAQPAVPTAYVPDSPVERSTGGAVKLYQIDGSVTGLAVLGENLLVCKDGDTLQLMGGDELSLVKERPLDAPVSWADPSLVLREDGMAWFDEDSNSYILLDANLVNTASVAIEEKLLCAPAISQDFSTIYYAAADGIKAMDLTSGVTRMLRQEHAQVICVDGLLLNDTLLRYTRQLEDGTEQTCFVDAADGSSRHTGQFQGQLATWGGSVSGIMKLTHPVGQSSWILSADANGVTLLSREDLWDSALLAGQNKVVLQYVDQMGLHLDLYDLGSGDVSCVMLPQFRDGFAYACYSGGKVWLCDGAGGKFYCWDAASTAMDKVVSPLTPVQLLDTDSLPQEALDRAEQLSDQYGVKVTFAEEGNRTAGVDYSVYPEYRPALYDAALDQLERLLKKVPREFWTQIGKRTDSGALEIVLTDDFDPALGTGGGTGYYSVENGEAALHVAISADLEHVVVHELWHVMEVRIRNKNDSLNTWNKLNPKDFAYADSYTAWENGELEDSAYLIPGENAVADSYGLVNEREDRAQILTYAMMEGQEELFDGDIMQAKLSKLCELIRSVYSIADDTQLPWEQYLAPQAEE